MSDLPGHIRVQDAVLANMVSIAAILEYLDEKDPGSKERIENRAHEIARTIKQQADSQNKENGA